MKRLAHSFAWYLYWLAAFLLALIAALLITTKLLFENIDTYRMQVQSYLSEQLQAQVHVGELQGSWSDWKPNLKMRGLSITNLQEQPGLSIGLLQAQIEINPAASLKAWNPVFSQFEFDGLKVRVDLTKLPAQTTEDKDSASYHELTDRGASLLTLLLQQQDVDLTKTRIEVLARTGEELSISPIHLQMQHDGEMHQLRLNADLSSQEGEAKIDFVAEVIGNPSRDVVDFYLNIEGLDHKLLNPWLRLADVELDSYEASQQVWGQIQDTRLVYLTGKTQVSNFRFEQYELEEFALHTALMRRDRSYQLQINDIYVSGAQQRLDLPLISLDLVRRGYVIEPQALMLDRVDLGKAQNWLLQQPFLPENIAAVIKSLSPQGWVENVKVTWKDGQDLTSFELAADLDRVGIDAWDDVPELKGINGLLTADINGGQIHLTSQAFSMYYPTLFRDTWRYDSADGIIGWRFEDQGVVVASQLLHLSDPSVSAAGRFSIYLPYSRDEQPLLNLQIGMKASDGKQARHYIPPKEVGEKTYEWLVSAIKEGHVKQAGFVLNGVTRARLSDYQLPVVQMFFDLSDASFAYQPGWPAIQQSDAFVFFRNGELVAQAQGGTLYDSAIEYAWVHLPQSTDKLFVNGAVKGDASDLYRLLTQSPLREEVGEELAEWQMSGPVDTQVDLQIPLYTDRQPQVQVRSRVENARFESEKERLSFTAVNGAVTYDSAMGLQADKLSARLFEHPVNAHINTQDRKTQVHINSAIRAEQLRTWLNLDFLRVVKGTIDYQARLDMCPGKSCNQLVINSELQGVAIDAPKPLAKEASQKSSLSIVSDLGRGYQDARSAIRLNLGNQLRGILVTDGENIERARFSLGGARPEVPTEPGIWLDGQLELLDYDELERFIENAGFVQEKQDAPAGEGSVTQLRAVDLKIEQFVFNNIQLHSLEATLTPVDAGWQLEVASPDVAGSLLLPQEDGAPYQADLDYLRLTTSDEEETAETSKEAPVEAKELPHLVFNARELTLDGKPLGQWSFRLSPIVNGVVVENIRGELYGAIAKGEVRWRSEEEPRSYLTLRLDSDDFGQVLQAWGISKSLETKSLKSYVQLNWDGTPWAFDIAKADGEVQFTAKKGRLLDVGNAGNFLRVFGILNLQSVGRRLRLDFSDLFKEGVAFDEMKANYVVDKGIATTSEPFIMVGPSVNMALKGSLDLKNETVDKDIEVAIPVTGNIPLISVLLGAPQVAGAVFLFDKLVGDPLEKFSTVKYHMSGPWADPKIEVYNDKDKTPKPPSVSSGDANG